MTTSSPGRWTPKGSRSTRAACPAAARSAAERRSRARQRRARAARGFTLVEIVVAIAVAVVLIAIAAPNVAEFGRERLFRAAMSEVEGAFVLARARAMHEGASLGVSVRRTPVGDCVLEIAPWDPVAELRELDEEPAGFIPGAAGPRRRSIGLSRGISIAALRAGEAAGEAPDGDLEPGAEAEAAGTSEGADLAGEPAEGQAAAPGDGPAVLVVFLPDGGAIASAPVAMEDAHGRRARITFGRWMGRVEVRRE